MESGEHDYHLSRKSLQIIQRCDYDELHHYGNSDIFSEDKAFNDVVGA